MAKPRRKSMRRAYLKVWSNGYINTGSRDDAPRRYGRVAMQDTVARHRNDADPPPRYPDDPVPSPRVRPRDDALDFARSLEAMIGTVHIEHKIVLRMSKFEQTCMFYGMKGSNCFLVKVSHGVLAQRSVIYDSREKAIRRYKDGQVIWVESRSIASPTNA